MKYIVTIQKILATHAKRLISYINLIYLQGDTKGTIISRNKTDNANNTIQNKKDKDKEVKYAQRNIKTKD